MRVGMFPHLKGLGKHESGIRRVVEAYVRHMPKFGVEIVDPKDPPYDLRAAHAGMTGVELDVCHCHGLYWTADYHAPLWEWRANHNVIEAIRHAKEVTVPSRWVAETFERDMHFSPTIVPHGIDADEWAHKSENQGYVLWNKNRTGDVCDPTPMLDLARKASRAHFVTTFAGDNTPNNVQVEGLQPHNRMKKMIQQAGVYLSTTKETFGIGILEAMASGVPVLGYGHGGILDLVEHGVQGYLAQPGNIDDLYEGLRYCLQHREALAANAQIRAREFSWQAACKKLAEVYDWAALDEPPTATIVIPSYNYADKVGRAVQSAIDQTYKGLREIVVVDDGSDDDGQTYRVVNAFEDRRVRYIRQENAGVAHARNRGIASTNSKYITCLDADDALAPNFLEVCIPELEADRSLGVVYTGLWYIKPDGEEGKSPWPEEFDYEKQLKRQNQIPTACVFRKEAWSRLGGYRQRYAPQGAGAEDAEFWLRMGAFGYGAKRATSAPLFIYSWQSGRVSGDPDYREVDWTGWHPWTRDRQFPMACIAEPRRFSHPVRQYDNPIVSVIVPVGPGHEHEVLNVLDSLEAQTLRGWEAIVVWDTPSQENLSYLRTAFPFVRWIKSHEGAPYTPQGAGWARNRGAEAARAHFLVFVDADDWLLPNALEDMVDGYAATGNIVYGDYVERSMVPDPEAYVEKIKSDPRGSVYGQTGNEVIVGRKAFDYECEEAVRQPNPERMYIWNLVTSFVPKAWHDEIGGFDENMPSWEDWDYYIRLARSGKCFSRITSELVLYRHHTGGRRQIGMKEYRRLVEYLQDKYEGEEPMGCNCGGKKSATLIRNNPLARATNGGSTAAATEASMQDENMVMCVYRSPNRGQHNVTGNATRINYGHRSAGERFLVHEADIRARPQDFVPVEELAPAAAPPPPAPAPAPAPPPQTEPAPQEAAAPAEAIEPDTEAFEVDREFEDVPEGQIQRPEVDHDEPIDLQSLPGITTAIQEEMEARDIATVGDILELGVEGLTEIRGIGDSKAATIIGYVKNL